MSLTAGTVSQDTRKPLRMWFLAMWFVTSQKNGVSALGLQRVLRLGQLRDGSKRGREVETKAIVVVAAEKSGRRLRNGNWRCGRYVRRCAGGRRHLALADRDFQLPHFHLGEIRSWTSPGFRQAR
jgi:hypothetical protein